MKPYFLTYTDCEKWLEYEKNIKAKKKKCKGEVGNYILEIREEEEKYILNNNSINKPHDKLFRELLDNKQEAIIFIKKFIDKENELKAEDIEKYNRTFITKEYNELQSDIIYKIKDKNVFFLIEHQSTRDYNMAYRFLKYALAITESVTEKRRIGNKGYKYPKVVPILIYTGEGKWNISDCLEQEEYKNLDKYGIELKYNIVDASEYTEEELLEMDSIVAYAMAIEKCRNDEELPKLLKKIGTKIKENERKKLISRIIKYILKERINKVEPQIIEQILKELEEREVEKAMSTLGERLDKGNEKLRKQIYQEGRTEGRMEGRAEGRAEGRTEGRAQGRIAGIMEIAKNMLKEKVEKNFITKMTGLTEEELNKIAKEIN